MATKTTKKTPGEKVIERYLKTLPGTPGVYRMINAKGDVLYVGKAKSLKKRVQSYTRGGRLAVRTRRMVADTASMEFVTTHTEAEALLLEADLIKRYHPRYNILLPIKAPKASAWKSKGLIPKYRFGFSRTRKAKENSNLPKQMQQVVHRSIDYVRICLLYFRL